MTRRSPGRHSTRGARSRSLGKTRSSRSGIAVGLVLAALLATVTLDSWASPGQDSVATAASRATLGTPVERDEERRPGARVARRAAAAAPAGSTALESSGIPAPSSSAPPSGTAPEVAPVAASPAGTRGILLSQEELMALPTSGPGWDALVARVQRPYGGAYVLGVRDDSNKDVLAHALVGARLDLDDLKSFVRDRIAAMIAAPRNASDVLATLRNLQAYVISADLIDLASFDPALDSRFRTWLAGEIRAEYSGGGGGGSVVSTHDRKPNNFGTHAGATRLVAALYLGDTEEYRRARDVWYGWATGDPAHASDARSWSGTDWQCGDGRMYGINPAGCTRDGVDLDGVIPEDQRRCGGLSITPCATNYVHGATDGMALSFWIMARQGENPWEWGDRAALRQMQWKYRVGQAPYGGFRWQIPVIEAAYGIDLPGNAPAATSTNMGYADWWAR